MHDNAGKVGTGYNAGKLGNAGKPGKQGIMLGVRVAGSSMVHCSVSYA